MAASNPNGSPEGVTVQPPAVIIRFAGPGSAEVASIEAPGISLGQLYLAAWLLDQLARENRQGEVAKAALTGGLTPAMQDVVRDIMAGAGRPGQRRD